MRAAHLICFFKPSTAEYFSVFLFPTDFINFIRLQKKQTMQNKRSLPEILKLLTEQDVKKIKLAIVDIDGVLRGKVISLEKFKSVAEKSFGFCDVVFGWDAADSAYDNAEFTGWHTGYPDATAVIDLQTFRQVPWEN